MFLGVLDSPDSCRLSVSTHELLLVSLLPYIYPKNAQAHQAQEAYVCEVNKSTDLCQCQCQGRAPDRPGPGPDAGRRPAGSGRPHWRSRGGPARWRRSAGSTCAGGSSATGGRAPTPSAGPGWCCLGGTVGTPTARESLLLLLLLLYRRPASTTPLDPLGPVS